MSEACIRIYIQVVLGVYGSCFKFSENVSSPISEGEPNKDVWDGVHDIQ
jgi:hypothetical protein